MAQATYGALCFGSPLRTLLAAWELTFYSKSSFLPISPRGGEALTSHAQVRPGTPAPGSSIPTRGPIPGLPHPTRPRRQGWGRRNAPGGQDQSQVPCAPLAERLWLCLRGRWPARSEGPRRPLTVDPWDTVDQPFCRSWPAITQDGVCTVGRPHGEAGPMHRPQEPACLHVLVTRWLSLEGSPGRQPQVAQGLTRGPLLLSPPVHFQG